MLKTRHWFQRQVDIIMRIGKMADFILSGPAYCTISFSSRAFRPYQPILGPKGSSKQKALWRALTNWLKCSYDFQACTVSQFLRVYKKLSRNPLKKYSEETTLRTDQHEPDRYLSSRGRFHLFIPVMLLILQNPEACNRCRNGRTSSLAGRHETPIQRL